VGLSEPEGRRERREGWESWEMSEGEVNRDGREVSKRRVRGKDLEMVELEAEGSEVIETDS
jgi:hypothetical protein